MNVWDDVCKNHWVDALFIHGGSVTNSGLYAYKRWLRLWMAQHPNPETKEYQFARLRYYMLDEMFKMNSASSFWVPGED